MRGVLRVWRRGGGLTARLRRLPSAIARVAPHRARLRSVRTRGHAGLGCGFGIAWCLRCVGRSAHAPGPNPGSPLCQTQKTPHARGSSCLAERGGFEPPNGRKPVNGFRDRRIRPLCHLSELVARKQTASEGHGSWRLPRSTTPAPLHALADPRRATLQQAAYCRAMRWGLPSDLQSVLHSVSLLMASRNRRRATIEPVESTADRSAHWDRRR